MAFQEMKASGVNALLCSGLGEAWGGKPHGVKAESLGGTVWWITGQICSLFLCPPLEIGLSFPLPGLWLHLHF